MSAEWYLYKEDTQYGPYTWEQICAFAREGKLLPEDHVWNSGMSGWAPAREVSGLLPGHVIPPSQAEEGKPRTMPGGRGEELLGIIPHLSKKAGIFKTKHYSLVVTNNRIIFAEATKKMMMDAVDEANESSKGKGMLARMAESFTSQDRIHKRYYNMSPQEILSENPDNFAVPISEVRNARFSHGPIDEGGQKYDDKLVIHTAREKIKLTLNTNNLGEAKKILWRVLGKSVR